MTGAQAMTQLAYWLYQASMIMASFRMLFPCARRSLVFKQTGKPRYDSIDLSLHHEGTRLLGCQLERFVKQQVESGLCQIA
jgi:hypothetical protein